ncbi:UDP-galactopyranose mutase [Desulfobaculum xiamenense]|uniref:UDP-galactopyranose mutase n=1 Tax=Desulfobaculum xiamenense TaxID=995050 RepID=A0A846QPR1_9BACT|nr:UDP-galactopyranose mutase [Desulfobaculum xiamenense]NJB69167.1 UDP-galactopyranose mutase [Desulfobaculum xiamenense]
MELAGLKYLVVGAGLFGAVMAERIAADMGERVLVIDRRDHTGGNCHSTIDTETGIERHVYGTHIFHTAHARVWKYINRFATFNSYRHRVLAMVDGRAYHMPVNLLTVNDFYGTSLRPWELHAFLAAEAGRDATKTPANLEEQAIALIGRPLYEAFIRDYTRKQWGVDPRRLPAAIVTRLPVRATCKTDYFDDPWQGLPMDGYAATFSRMLAHPLIDVALGVDHADIRERIPEGCTVIYTGPLDRYFDHRYGPLGWRSLEFHEEIHLVPDFQGAAVVNHPAPDVPWTRIHEFRHLHEEREHPAAATLIAREYPRELCTAHPEPYYPMRLREDRERLALYQRDAHAETRTIFGGRLGTYAYLDMDTTILQALEAYDRLCERLGTDWTPPHHRPERPVARG